ncbi:putative Protein kinase domain-containing protein [Seiridium unicorne]|uniref:Protein kinase domain-containing protein n=1 Tax=Seiridium unicorne TaxID=138068 RepID=A0ABR2ULJ1_9PEZI
MRYHEACRLFKTKHWGTLWQNNILDLDGLTEKSQHTFVAIDFEGLIAKDERIGITEIGIAVLFPPVSDSRISEEDLKSQGQTPQAFLAQNAVESHWIKIKGRGRRERSQDQYYFDQAEEIEAEQCETALVSLLRAIRQRSRSPLALVGFDLVFEFKTVASHLFQITQYFSSWVDLQEITAEISNANSPGMKDTLLAFGFFRPDLAVRGKSDHNAGNDAIRQLAVLVNLLNLRKGYIKADNIMFGIQDDSVFEAFEEEELQNPSPRKLLTDRTVYASRALRTPKEWGAPVLCDFGSAVSGEGEHLEDIQPDIYRAPEVILQIPWTYSVDIWNVGCMVGTLKLRPIEVALIAEVIALLGKPSPDFLARGGLSHKFFSPEGNFIAKVQLTDRVPLEEREITLEGRDKVSFLRLMRKMVEWEPSKRCSAKELAEDEWIQQNL